MVGTIQYEFPVARYPRHQRNISMYFSTVLWVILIGIARHYQSECVVYFLIFQQRPPSVVGGGDQGVECTIESGDMGESNGQ